MAEPILDFGFWIGLILEILFTVKYANFLQP
jgi:hypothetical protein